MDKYEAKESWARAWERMLRYEEASRIAGDPGERARLLHRWHMAAAELSELEERWGPLGPVELAARSRGARSEREPVAASRCGDEDRARA